VVAAVVVAAGKVTLLLALVMTTDPNQFMLMGTKYAVAAVWTSAAAGVVYAAAALHVLLPTPSPAAPCGSSTSTVV
jgi:hypothetical protein